MLLYLCVTGSSRASWLCKQPLNDTCHSINDLLRHALPDSDSTSLGSLTTSNASTLDSASDLPGHQTGLKESISDENKKYCEQNECQDSRVLGSAIETKFQMLQLTEQPYQAPAPCVQPESEGNTTERQAFFEQANFCAMKRKPGRSSKNSFRQGKMSQNMRRRSHSLDSQTESMANNVDFNSLLETDFNVQSLTSIVNENIFYDNTTEVKNGAATTS